MYCIVYEHGRALVVFSLSSAGLFPSTFCLLCRTMGSSHGSRPRNAWSVIIIIVAVVVIIQIITIKLLLIIIGGHDAVHGELRRQGHRGRGDEEQALL